MFEEVKTLLAYRTFSGSFKSAIPNLEVYNPLSTNISDYDLVIFTGGEDINPARYQNECTYSNFNDERDTVEFEVLNKVLLSKSCGHPTKILGTCRGHQLVYVGLGGSLIQDINIERQVFHSGWHELIPETAFGEKLSSLFPDGVNSMHHQAIESMNRSRSSLEISNSCKGVAEAFISTGIICVQFHPEFMDLNYARNFWLFIENWVMKDKDKKPTKRPTLSNTRKSFDINPRFFTEDSTDR